MAKRTVEITTAPPLPKRPEKVTTGDPFAGSLDKAKPLPLKFYAVRKIKGPGEYPGYVVFKAYSDKDAKRQWFNHTGTSTRSHLFNLQVRELSANHPSVKEAIQAQAPSGEGGTTLRQMMDQDFSDVQQEIARGGRKEPGQTVTKAT